MSFVSFDAIQTHLISPEWDLRALDLTSSRIPGSPATLQNGINTAAFLVGGTSGVRPCFPFFEGSEALRAFRRIFRVLGVNGLDKDIKVVDARELYGRKDIKVVRSKAST